MVKRIAILFFVVFAEFAQAQNRANIWQLGDNPSNMPDPSMYIDFNSGSAVADTVIRAMSFFNTNASICDTTGQLLFYTNGVYIANRNHDSLLNTVNFNPGYWTDFYGNDGMGIPQGALIIAIPGSYNLYGIFTVSGEYGDFYGKTYAPLYLSYSEVDMNLDSGLGGIIKKNIHLVEDTIMWGRLTACKHANGRDWWIITHKFFSDKYYKLLIEPDTMILYEQSIGNIFSSYDANGMAVFSPNGSQYAHLNMNDTIELLQFDRCTGEFFNPITLAVPDSPITLSATLGCQFSPNSRFLYVNSYRRVWQFDSWATDIQASLILIDTINPLTIYPLFLQQLAPDGKIYISTFNTNGAMPVLHVINKPDDLGPFCNVEFHGFPLPPVTGNFCVPNFPNYDLGSLLGSPCDTLFNNVSEPKEIEQLRLKILPNPNNGTFTTQYHLPQLQEGEIKIINLYGEIIANFKRPMWSSILNLSLPNLPKGLYLVKLRSGEKTVSTKMIVE